MMTTYLTVITDAGALTGYLVSSGKFAIVLKIPSFQNESIASVRKGLLCHRIINGDYEVIIPVNEIGLGEKQETHLTNKMFYSNLLGKKFSGETLVVAGKHY
jgi:hypothetical protein